MKTIFVPGWMSYINDSMSICTQKSKSPGWIFFPCNPHPYDNKYHYISDGVSGIFYTVEIADGKD